jgi:sulfoxide reductase heme-binding subunit YedZ
MQRTAVAGFWQRNYRWAVHAGALAPFAWTLWLVVSDGLTVNPIQDLTLRTGRTALVLLLASLACSPANRWLKWKWALKARRTLGLYAFFYALLHVLIFTVLDYGLDLPLIFAAAVEKRFVLVGMGAFTILLLLAVTSFDYWKVRLRKNWKRLHRLVYLAGGLVILHYAWAVKSDVRVPLAYGAVLLFLLVLRLPLFANLFPRKRSAK